ncbi:hypothetical protein [Spirulina sp. 06S082]|uniref:hypothetical protein n=1 Tax=Spirulina sp. 06S082 TaxID=3110248 RepID=UPI002B1F5C39|nr:hypothetical protein [Spirulina sp. 06S082]MEA5468908.1 hypothetical protein [Spirulina sp. 06S082]
MSKLRNILKVAGVATAGAIGTKLAVDFFKKRGKKEEAVSEDAPDILEPVDDDAEPSSTAEVAYAAVKSSSVQTFLDKSFGDSGRYVPDRAPKVFEYQGKQYMVIWADDTQKNKKQMMAFLYTDAGRKMVASVGYTLDTTDYNISLEDTPFAVEVNGDLITSGQSTTDGTDEVDFVLA